MSEPPNATNGLERALDKGLAICAEFRGTKAEPVDRKNNLLLKYVNRIYTSY